MSKTNKVWDGMGMTDSFRIPPDGMESASLLRNENCADNGGGGLGGGGLGGAGANPTHAARADK